MPAEPAATFPQRFAQAARRGGHDLVYVSQVFFNSGATSGDLFALASAVRDPQTLVAIDGYHGFMAVPTDLAAVADRVFYIAGGYKYAMAGEGACFMHCPPGFAPRPRDTGWFAAFGALTEKQKGVPYGADGSRFLGATFDPSGLYRMRAVFAWLEEIGLTVAAIHAHVLALQKDFLDRVRGGAIAGLDGARLVTPMEGSAPRPLPHLRDAARRGAVPRPPRPPHRHRRPRPPHPLRLRLLPRGPRHRPRGRADVRSRRDVTSADGLSRKRGEAKGAYAAADNPPARSMKAATASTPSPARTLVKTKGRSRRILWASRSITSRSAPTRGARSILLITRRSERVMPGPPLRGILSPAETSMT